MGVTAGLAQAPAEPGTGYVSLTMPSCEDFKVNSSHTLSFAGFALVINFVCKGVYVQGQWVAKQEQLARQAGYPEAQVQQCRILANQNKLAFLGWRSLTVVCMRRLSYTAHKLLLIVANDNTMLVHLQTVKSKGKARQILNSASGYLEPRSSSAASC